MLTRGIGLVRTTPEQCENSAFLFPRLGLPCILIRHENGASNENSLQIGGI